MIIEITIPRIILKKLSNNVPICDKLFRKRLIDSGIKSVIETVIITPAAKASDDKIILSVFFFLLKITSVPIIVERPAIIVKRKAKLVLFIASPN